MSTVCTAIRQVHQQLLINLDGCDENIENPDLFNLSSQQTPSYRASHCLLMSGNTVSKANIQIIWCNYILSNFYQDVLHVYVIGKRRRHTCQKTLPETLFEALREHVSNFVTNVFEALVSTPCWQLCLCHGGSTGMDEGASCFLHVHNFTRNSGRNSPSIVSEMLLACV